MYKFSHRSICFFIYILSSILIISYGMKLGQVKSVHWLMTIIITILQNIFIAEPILVLMVICVANRFNQVTKYLMIR